MTKFPAASERLAFSHSACDVTRRGTSSCREPLLAVFGEVRSEETPDESFGRGR